MPQATETYHYCPGTFDEPAEAPVPSTDEKRNSGRTGPTSPAGRATSSKNAIKHGACSRTLILPHESVGDWELLLSHWRNTYQPKEDSLEFDFVLRAAQAEWYRLRAQRNYDDFLASLETRAAYCWDPSEIKAHDLMLRYKTAAERAFQRDYRLLEHHYKTHKPAPVQEPVSEAAPPASSTEHSAQSGETHSYEGEPQAESVVGAPSDGPQPLKVSNQPKIVLKPVVS
jgi:hypothetical protein